MMAAIASVGGEISARERAAMGAKIRVPDNEPIFDVDGPCVDLHWDCLDGLEERGPYGELSDLQRRELRRDLERFAENRKRAEAGLGSLLLD
jgi:hypothetical protein